MADEKFEEMAKKAFKIFWEGYEDPTPEQTEIEFVIALRAAGFDRPSIPPELIERLQVALNEYDMDELEIAARALLDAHNQNKEADSEKQKS